MRDALAGAPFAFDLDQAARHLERLRPQAEPLGCAGEPAREAVRLRAAVRLDFPPSDVERVELPGTAGGPAELVVNAMGLAGALGPLPHVDTERVLARLRRGDTALRDFLDIFNHRFLALFLRARRPARPWLAPEPPWESGAARKLYALLGLGTPGLQGRLGIPDRLLLRYAGLLARRPPSLHALQRVVADHFGLRVVACGLVGRWRALGPDQQTVLGRDGRNRKLGGGAVLGGRAWDQAGALELRIGPLGRGEFESLLPTGGWHRRLLGVVAFATDRRVDVAARLVLRADALAPPPLARGDGPRLGWTSWIARTRPAGDDDQVVLRLQSAM